MRRVQALPLCLATLLALFGAVDAQQAPETPSPSAKAQANRPTKQKPASHPPAAVAKPHPIVPQPEVLLLLIRTTLVALDQANKTNNYTVLREIGGPSLQKFMSAQLGELFAGLRTKNIDLAPTVVVTPQMFQAPAILSNGMLRLSGYFPTQPMQINFDLLFEQTNSTWKLAGLRVSAVQSSAQSQSPPAAAPPAKQDQ